MADSHVAISPAGGDQRKFSSFRYSPSPVSVRFARGQARSEITDAIASLDIQRPFVITTASKSDLARDLTMGIGATYFTGARQHIPEKVVETATAAALLAHADGIVSIGGGSATGTAKAVALGTRLPIVAVPTTFAGSEVTPVWGTSKNGVKTTGRAPAALPRVVIYDADLQRTLPPAMAVTSAVNALAHAIEGFWAPGANPVTDVHAAQATHTLIRALCTMTAFDQPDRMHDELLFGAYLAGTVFADTGSGLHHRVCHALGGAYDLPHASTHAVVLPHIVALNAPLVPQAMIALRSSLGATDVAPELFSLLGKVDAPRSLRSLGMPEVGIDRVAESVADEIPQSNPVSIDASVLRTVLRAAWNGVE